MVDPLRRTAWEPESWTPRANPAVRELGLSIVSDLADDLWQALEDALLDTKSEASESADPAGAAPDLPVDRIERERRLVGYHEVLPYAPTT